MLVGTNVFADECSHNWVSPYYTQSGIDKHHVYQKCSVCGEEEYLSVNVNCNGTVFSKQLISTAFVCHIDREYCVCARLVSATTDYSHVMDYILSNFGDPQKHDRLDFCGECNYSILGVESHSFDANGVCSCGYMQ